MNELEPDFNIGEPDFSIENLNQTVSYFKEGVKNPQHVNIEQHDPVFLQKQQQAKLNQYYTLIKLYINGVMLAGFDEISLNTESIYHISNIQNAVIYIQKNYFGNIIFSTLEDTLLSHLALFADEDKFNRNAHRSYFLTVQQQINEYQRKNYDKANEANIPLSRSEIEKPKSLSAEDYALISYFKMLFNIGSDTDIALIGRSLRRHFKHLYTYMEKEDLQADRAFIFNTPLYERQTLPENAIELLKNWVTQIHQEQIRLSGIIESNQKLLEIGFTQHIEQAIENVLYKLPVNTQYGITLNEIKQHLPNFEKQWQCLEIGLNNFYDFHII